MPAPWTLPRSGRCVVRRETLAMGVAPPCRMVTPPRCAGYSIWWWDDARWNLSSPGSGRIGRRSYKRPVSTAFQPPSSKVVSRQWLVLSETVPPLCVHSLIPSIRRHKSQPKMMVSHLFYHPINGYFFIQTTKLPPQLQKPNCLNFFLFIQLSLNFTIISSFSLFFSCCRALERWFSLLPWRTSLTEM